MNPNYFRWIYHEALDLVISTIQKRFEQSNHQLHVALQNLLIKTVNNEDFSYKHTLVSCDKDIVPACLKLQLKIFTEDCSKLSEADLQLISTFTKMLPIPRKSLSVKSLH